MYTTAILGALSSAQHTFASARRAYPGAEVDACTRLLDVLHQHRDAFVGTHFERTIYGLEHDLSGNDEERKQIAGKRGMLGLIRRAKEWQELELTKSLRLTVYRVSTPVGTYSVMAKSFIGARVAAAERYFDSIMQTGCRSDREAFRLAVPHFAVELCVHSFCYISELEARQKRPSRFVKSSVSPEQEDAYMLRHWTDVGRTIDLCLDGDAAS